MNIAIIGFGSMGKKIKELAENLGHSISIIIDPLCENADYKSILSADFNNTDIVIDFSTLSSVIENAKIVARAGKNLVIGTTGWYEKLEEVEKIAKDSGIGIFWSANFSLGVNMYYKIIEQAAILVNKNDEYDIWGTELHHNNKIDSPSGTTKEIAKILLENIDKKTEVVYDKLDRKIKPNEIHFSSTRGGVVNFSHTVGFDGANDTITIIHNARDRGGYAVGAIKVAEWMNGKKGFYNMNDFLND